MEDKLHPTDTLNSLTAGVGGGPWGVQGSGRSDLGPDHERAGAALASLDRLRTILESPSLAIEAKMGLYEKVSRLGLLLEMARRAGRKRTEDAEIEKFIGLPWPVVAQLHWEKKQAGPPLASVAGATLTPTSYLADVPLIGKPAPPDVAPDPHHRHGRGDLPQDRSGGKRKWGCYFYGPDDLGEGVAGLARGSSNFSWILNF